MGSSNISGILYLSNNLIMATIVYDIAGNNPPFVARLYLGAVLVDTNNHTVSGQYHFANLADGDYTIIVVDDKGCVSFFDATVNCVTTTVELNTTEEITTTEGQEQPTTTLESTTTVEVTTTEEITTTNESTTTVEATTTEEPTTTTTV